MEDLEFVNEIKEYVKKKSQNEFGFCGIAEGDNFIMLNTGKGNVKIKIEWEDEPHPNQRRTDGRDYNKI